MGYATLISNKTNRYTFHSRSKVRRQSFSDRKWKSQKGQNVSRNTTTPAWWKTRSRGRGVWKTRGLVKNAGCGKRRVWCKTRGTIFFAILTRESLTFSQCVAPFKPRSHRSSGAFLLVRISLHSCIFFLPDILRLCDRKFVFTLTARAAGLFHG